MRAGVRAFHIHHTEQAGLRTGGTVSQHTTWRGLTRVFILLTLMAATMGRAGSIQAAGPPTVNGLFYGDGDVQRYTLYNTSVGGSGLYYYLHDSTLYVALVVGREVNDNVFGNRNYTRNAGWNPPHTAERLIDSEFAGFSLECGAHHWAWQQGYAGQPADTNNTTQPTWFSDPTAAGGGGTPPPGLVSASSFAWNLNTYATNPTPAWNMTLHGSRINDWKSPFDAAAPDMVLGMEGYPTTGQIGFSTVHQWEWPMVYEWAVDLSPICLGSPLFVVSGMSHHSPAKNGLENDVFPEPNQDDPADRLFTDFGDLPDLYGTLLAGNGARHTIVVGGAYLGSVPPDVETDGQPSADALGDDRLGNNDEEGVVFLTPFTPGGDMLIQVTAGTPGYLSAFVDFNNDGSLSPVTLTSATGPAPVTPGILGDTHLAASGVYTLRVALPNEAAGILYSRWRITTHANEGGNGTTGLASSGEVEDYALALISGYVWEDVNGNGLQDTGEPGTENVLVELLDEHQVPVLDAAGDPVTTQTDSRGTYTFPGLPPGRYRLRVVAPNGYGITQQGRGGGAGQDSVPDPITGSTRTYTLTAGATKVDVDAGLISNAPTAARLTGLSARGTGAIPPATLAGALVLWLCVTPARKGSRHHAQ